MKYLVLVMVLGLVCFTGCTKDQAATIQSDIATAKTVIQLSDEALNAANTLVNTAAPGSKTATKLDKITSTANKVNGKIQSISITIPVEDATTGN